MASLPPQMDMSSPQMDMSPPVGDELELSKADEEAVDFVVGVLISDMPLTVMRQMHVEGPIPLIVIPNGVINMSAVLANITWLKAFAMGRPSKGFNQFEIARVILDLDETQEGKILKDVPNEIKLARVMAEATRGKELISYARLLCRRSPFSRDPQLQALKNLYKKQVDLCSLSIEGLDEQGQLPPEDLDASEELHPLMAFFKDDPNAVDAADSEKSPKHLLSLDEQGQLPLEELPATQELPGDGLPELSVLSLDALPIEDLDLDGKQELPGDGLAELRMVLSLDELPIEDHGELPIEGLDELPSKPDAGPNDIGNLQGEPEKEHPTASWREILRKGNLKA